VPELPEVESARRLIAGRALGRPIAAVPIADPYVCRPHSAGELRDALAGRTLTAACRRGKQLWCETSGTDGSVAPGPDLGIHLGMGGIVVVVSADGRAAEAGEETEQVGGGARPRRPEWNRFSVEFADGGGLSLFDTRRLARVRLNPDVGALGPDAEQVTPAEFRRLLLTGTTTVKARLLDQSKISGIGNLLADEALWRAKMSPVARVDGLRRSDADRLYRALQAVLRPAVAAGGLPDDAGMLAERHPGGRCPRCGAEMKHGTVGGRSTWWCSREQARKRPRKPATGRA
jgi:formamidopyrimidine-DNA glycosylase